jgi:REP element-mobilizing transposase RayT
MPFHSRKSRHNLRPDWVDEKDPLFITICHKRRGIRHFDHSFAWEALLASAEHARTTGRWEPILFLAMPDHLHAIARIARHPDITHAMGEFKRHVSYRMPTEWQKGSFDHRLRSYADYLEKRDYILMNPVRAGFARQPENWPYVAWWETEGYECPDGVSHIFKA